MGLFLYLKKEVKPYEPEQRITGGGGSQQPAIRSYRGIQERLKERNNQQKTALHSESLMKDLLTDMRASSDSVNMDKLG